MADNTDNTDNTDAPVAHVVADRVDGNLHVEQVSVHRSRYARPAEPS